MQRRPSLPVNASDRDHRITVEVDGPEALSQWCLEVALLLCGHSSSFTAVSVGEWKGPLWFGLGANSEDGVRIERDQDKVLIFMHRDLVDHVLTFSIHRYRTGRGWNEEDWGVLTVKLSGPAWPENAQAGIDRAKRHKK